MIKHLTHYSFKTSDQRHAAILYLDSLILAVGPVTESFAGSLDAHDVSLPAL